MNVPIFYDTRQNVNGVSSYSHSAGKPSRFVELAARNGWVAREQVTPVCFDDLAMVHDRQFLLDLFDGRANNGFENVDPRVPPSCLWTTGSLLAATRQAMANPIIPACSPTSGFHHAFPDFSSGFCTVNGLMVVAKILVQENPGIRIGYLDLDMHTGDGCLEILRRDRDLARHVMYRTQGPHFIDHHDAKGYQSWLIQRVAEMNRFSPDVVILQAGADPHIDDPLGGLLTSEQLALRDKTVFEGIKAGIAWNLAGGYQEGVDDTLEADPVLKIHLATLRAAEASISVRQKLLELA